jgi:RimJ/RimL family protein N-acetyltransferase
MSQMLVGNVLFGADQMVAEFVMDRIPEVPRDTGFGKFVALGIVRDNALVGGVVFHNYRGHDIEMSAASDDPRFLMGRDTLKTLFFYPFVTAGCTRMTTITSQANKRARKIDEKLGFKLEGLIRRGWDGNKHAIVFGMLRSECRWLPKELRVDGKGHSNGLPAPGD